MVSLSGITKRFGSGASASYVLRNITLSISEGEFVSIMGPSGSGKSTLLNIIGMLDEPTSGEYLFRDVPAARMRERDRAEIHRNEIGFVFQSYHLIEDLTVYENLETPLIYKSVGRADRKARVAEMLDRFGIVAKKDLFPPQLSGGQQQIVGIARALIIQPRLLLADEPTGNLHSSQGSMVMRMLRELNEKDGVTIIHVTHSDRWATYASRIVHLCDGEVSRIERVTERAEVESQ
jgi:putative ABC transport system ATP-binding protein